MFQNLTTILGKGWGVTIKNLVNHQARVTINRHDGSLVCQASDRHAERALTLALETATAVGSGEAPPLPPPPCFWVVSWVIGVPGALVKEATCADLVQWFPDDYPLHWWTQTAIVDSSFTGLSWAVIRKS